MSPASDDGHGVVCRALFYAQSLERKVLIFCEKQPKAPVIYLNENHKITGEIVDSYKDRKSLKKPFTNDFQVHIIISRSILKDH